MVVSMVPICKGPRGASVAVTAMRASCSSRPTSAANGSSRSPGRRQLHATGMSAEEDDAEVRLQLLDAVGDVGLGGVEPCRRTADGCFPAHRQEEFEVSALHGRTISFSYD